MQAIETRYAGCRFRSRLEARWAVFFDTAGIRWEYEPQGYLIGEDTWQRPYLPDFYLTDLGLWVEVKGREADLDYRLLVDCAIPHWGLPLAGTDSSRAGLRMLVLGPLPHGRRDGWYHSALSFWKGDVHVVKTFFHLGGVASAGSYEYLLGSDAGDVYPPTKWDALLDPWPGSPFAPDVEAAYSAARSARFEHGEHG